MAMPRIDSPSRKYRVVANNCVLNYYHSRDAAAKYMRVLAKYSPDTYADAGIQVRDVDDPYVYHDLSPFCY